MLARLARGVAVGVAPVTATAAATAVVPAAAVHLAATLPAGAGPRSGEDTSELQAHPGLVCPLPP